MGKITNIRKHPLGAQCWNECAQKYPYQAAWIERRGMPEHIVRTPKGTYRKTSPFEQCVRQCMRRRQTPTRSERRARVARPTFAPKLEYHGPRPYKPKERYPGRRRFPRYAAPPRPAIRGLGQPPGANTNPPYCGGIRPLQQMLSDLGYYTGTVDGRYGQNTEWAMAKFKREEGLGSGFVTRADCERLIERWNMLQEGTLRDEPAPGTQPAVIPRAALRTLARQRVRIPEADNGRAADNGAQLDTAQVDTGVAAWWGRQSTVTKAAVIGGGVAVIGGVIYLAVR